MSPEHTYQHSTTCTACRTRGISPCTEQYALSPRSGDADRHKVSREITESVPIERSAKKKKKRGPLRNVCSADLSCRRQACPMCTKTVHATVGVGPILVTSVCGPWLQCFVLDRSRLVVLVPSAHATEAASSSAAEVRVSNRSCFIIKLYCSGRIYRTEMCAVHEAAEKVYATREDRQL